MVAVFLARLVFWIRFCKHLHFISLTSSSCCNAISKSGMFSGEEVGSISVTVHLPSLRLLVSIRQAQMCCYPDECFCQPRHEDYPQLQQSVSPPKVRFAHCFLLEFPRFRHRLKLQSPSSITRSLPSLFRSISR